MAIPVAATGDHGKFDGPPIGIVSGLSGDEQRRPICDLKQLRGRGVCGRGFDREVGPRRQDSCGLELLVEGWLQRGVTIALASDVAPSARPICAGSRPRSRIRRGKNGSSGAPASPASKNSSRMGHK